MDKLTQSRYDYIFKNKAIFEKVRRDDIAGAKPLLQAFQPIIEQVRDYRELVRLGIDLAGGALLYGPRGTGKTHFSKYLATESNARFINMPEFPRPVINGSRAELMPENIFEIYRLSQQYVKLHRKPIILFYDEFENVEDGIIQALRTEIQGIKGKASGTFLVLTATVGDPSNIDAGLMRAGRVSIHIPFSYPNSRERSEILRHYAAKKFHEKNIDYDNIANLMPSQTTPAGIELLVNEAYDLCRRQSREEIPTLTQQSLFSRCMESFLGFVLDDSMDDQSKQAVAFHESGHAVLGMITGMPVQIVTIYRTIEGGCSPYGKTISLYPDNRLFTFQDLESEFVGYFGGVAAQEEFSLGKFNLWQIDLGSATACAQNFVENMLCGRNLSRCLGPMVLNRQIEKYSEPLREMVEKDAVALLRRAEEKARRLIHQNRKTVERVARALIEKNVLVRNELTQLISQN